MTTSADPKPGLSRVSSAFRHSYSSPETVSQPAELRAVSSILALRVGLTVTHSEIAWETLEPQVVVEAAARHRVVGLLLTSPAVALLPERATHALGTSARRQALLGMKQAEQTRRLVSAFSASRVRYLVMKGQAFSTVVYGDWLVRGVAADLDLLIMEDSVEAAHILLTGLGYSCGTDGLRRPPLRGWRGAYGRWLHYERSYSAPGQLNVDVHWRPVPGSAPWTKFESLWERREQIVLHGIELDTPGPAECIRIAAAQGIPDGWPTLRSAVDFLSAANRVDQPELDSLCSSDRLVAAARNLAPGILLEGNPNWASRLQPRRERWLRQWHHRHLTGSTPEAVARSLLGVLVPARQLMPRSPAED